MRIIRRKNRVLYKIKFREPVTPDILMRACVASGVEIDRFYREPKDSLDDVVLTIDTAQEFLKAVSKSPPNLQKMSVEQGLGIAYMALTDFFLHTYTRHVNAQMSVSLHSGNVPGFLPAAAAG